MKKTTLLSLLAIFLLALFLRLINLSMLPHSFHTDELFAGYVGRYIFLHFTDIYGNIFPFYINKFGDYRPIGIFWLSGFSTFIFGINEFATRFPAALFGALTIFPVFYTAYLLFKNKWIGIICAFLLAVLPWHITLSRTTSEAIIGLFFYIVSFYFFLVFTKNSSLKSLFVSIVSGLISYLFYHSFRILLPLTFLPFLFLAPGKKSKLITFITVIFFFAISSAISMSSAGSGRFNQVVFYKDFALQNQITYLTAGDGQNNVLTARIFHNKAVVYTRGFLKQYFSYFSPGFLLEDYGLPARYVSPDIGQLFYIFVPFLFLSLLFIFPYIQKDKKIWLIFYLLFIAALPGAFTYDDSPNISRSCTMIIPLVLLTAFGIYESWKKIINTKLRTSLTLLCVVLFCLEFTYFWHEYSVHQKTFKSILRNDGNKELVQYVAKNKNKYSAVYMPSSDDLTIYYLFYTQNFPKFSPGEINQIQNGKPFQNIHFINDLCIDALIKNDKTVVTKNSLVIIGGDCKNVGINSKVIVTRSDGTLAYKSFEVH